MPVRKVGLSLSQFLLNSLMLNSIVCECLILDFTHQTINVEIMDRNSLIPLSKVGFPGGDFHNTGCQVVNFCLCL
jgi:hypothetical protein